MTYQPGDQVELKLVDDWMPAKIIDVGGVSYVEFDGGPGRRGCIRLDGLTPTMLRKRRHLKAVP